jgi:DNA-binding beta-propeller fold protein YncE
MDDLRIGSTFAGHRIDAIAGRGGMGVVYRATQLALDRTIALKVVAPVLVDDPLVRDRFVREARSAASLEHPHVIPIHYAGEEAGVGYIAMRHVDGDDLRQLVRHEGPIAPHRAARLIAQVAAALDAAHAAGLVHRDVKPANVLLGPDDHVYLTDFGLTKCLAEASAATHTGGWIGTLDYVAPEQIRGERVDARTDVYALGCLLYFLLAGRVPFTGEGHERKLWAHLTEPAPPLDGLPAFDRVIARATAKRPADRYQSAGDLGRAALAAAQGAPLDVGEHSVAVGEAAAAGEDDTTVATPPLDSLTPPGERGRRPNLAMAAVALVLAGGGALAIALVGGDPSRPPPKASASSAPQPTVSRIDVRTVRLEHQANAIALAGGHVWLASFGTPELLAFDPLRAAPVASTDPVGGGVIDIAGRGDVLWVAQGPAAAITPLDARSGALLRPTVKLAHQPVAVAADPRGAWVGLRGATPGVGLLVRVDRAAGQITRTYEVRGGVERVETFDGAVWVATSTSHRLLRLNAGTGRVERSIRLAAGGVGDLEAGGGYLWATLSGQGRLARVDPRTGGVRLVDVGRLPWGMAYTGGTVYVANRGSASVSRVDADTLRPLGSPTRVPADPFVMTAGDGAVWVSCLSGRRVVRLRARP